jgi:dihydropyrimidinase
MDGIIKNGTIITEADRFQADVVIKDGKIACIGQDLASPGGFTIDATGLMVLPGAIDAHVHFQTPVGQAVSADDYASGTRAAACGGVTTVFDFAVQRKGQGLLDDAKAKIASMQPKACIDFSLHTAITDLTPAVLEEFSQSADFGISSFKLYMVYEGLMVSDGELAAALEKSAETGTLIAVHAENPDLIRHRTEQLLREGKTTAWHHYESRPEFVEADAVRKVIHLAKALRTAVYIVHLACKEGLDEVTKARDEGFEIYAETCPQYLRFNNEVYRKADGVNFVCSPSIKGEDSRIALWEGVARGDIATIGSDHCPFQSFEKAWGKDDFTKIPNGCMGTETLYPYMLSEANQGHISFNKAVEVCSTNVARIFGCLPQKGTLAPSSDADIVVYDPNKDLVISKDNMHSNVDYTIWEGTVIKGYPRLVFSRGKLVFNEGQFVGEPGWGEFVKCQGKNQEVSHHEK